MLSVDDPTTENAADEYEIGNATVVVVLPGDEFIHCTGLLSADSNPHRPQISISFGNPLTVNHECAFFVFPRA